MLKRDPNELYRAASDAEKAVDYMKSHMIERDLKKEEEKTVQMTAEKDVCQEAVTAKTPPQERPKHNIQRTIELKPRKRRVVARRSPAKEQGRERALSR